MRVLIDFTPLLLARNLPKTPSCSKRGVVGGGLWYEPRLSHGRVSSAGGRVGTTEIPLVYWPGKSPQHCGSGFISHKACASGAASGVAVAGTGRYGLCGQCFG